MPFTLTTYITAESLVSTLGNPGEIEKACALLREAGVARVVLEGYAAGVSAPESTLVSTRDAFRKAGFETLGGMMPLYGGDFGRASEGIELRLPTFCYTDESTVAGLETHIRILARVFGEVVIDDGLITACRCDACATAKAHLDWAEYRRDRLAFVAERWVRAAHEENPGARVIVKFPQYYDRYQRFGYDAGRLPAIFDGVWQGSETRNPETLEFGYVEPYQGYFNLQWMRVCAGEKCESAWFDFLDCDEQLFYDQAVTTSTGAPRQLVLHRYDEELFRSSHLARLIEERPLLESLHDTATAPRGVHVIKPVNSNGGRDVFLFDYLGMLGIPCVPAHDLSNSMRSVIVTAHATENPETVRAIPKALIAGRTVIATFDALYRMRSFPDVLDYFGYRSRGISRAHAPVTEFLMDDAAYPADGPFRVAGDLAPTDASVRVWAELESVSGTSARVPFVTAKSFASGGRALVWNLGSFGHDAFDIREQLNVPEPTTLFNLPKEIVDRLRRQATSPCGFTIEAPARVATYLFAGAVVFVNYSATPAEVRLSGLAWNAESLVTDSGRTICSKDMLFLAPKSFALLKTAG